MEIIQEYDVDETYWTEGLDVDEDRAEELVREAYSRSLLGVEAFFASKNSPPESEAVQINFIEWT